MLKKTNLKSFLFSPITAVLILSFLVRLFLYKSGTYELDLNTFVVWSNNLIEGGFSSFYQNAWSDYLPGYLYILYALGKFKDLVLVDQLLIYKLPAMLADILTGLLIYKIISSFKDKRLGLLGASLYVFNPAIIGNSTLWGQVDSLTALFSLFSIYLLRERKGLSAVSLAFGATIKPQAAIASLVVLFEMIKEKWELKEVAKYIAIAGVFTLILFVPFSSEGSFINFVLERIGITLNQYPYGSVNAFNLWGIHGFWKPDTEGVLSPKTIGYLVFTGSFLISAKFLIKKKISPYLLLAIAFAANFMFFTRMHERHLLPVFAPLLISSFNYPLLIISYIGYSLTYVANLHFAYGAITGEWSVFGRGDILAIIITNILLFGLMFSTAVSEKVRRVSFESIYKFLKKRLSIKKTKIISFIKNNSKLILYGILLFSLITRIFALGSPPKEYFDEVYHAFTARKVLEGDPKAWEWWNESPEGFAYEWTHPPVAKLAMAGSMYLFGESAFGWRLPAALMGVFSVYLVYLISKRLFEDEVVAVLSAALISLDGLFLVMSRIGMNDIYLLTFGLLSYYLFLKKRHLASSFSLGLALASKWSAVWLAPIFLVSHFVLKRKIKLSYVLYFLIPPAIYLASYIPMFLTGHGFDIFVGVQKQMWWYHTRLEATHAYTSAWWSWPFMVRPIWLYTSGKVNGLISNIYAMGNPFIFWFGAFSVVIAAIHSYFEKNKKMGLVIFSYLVFFASWAASPRIMFLYHYLPSIPFMVIISAWVLKKYPNLIIPLLSISLVSFIYFYPHITGLKVPVWLDVSYYWFSSWR